MAAFPHVDFLIVRPVFVIIGPARFRVGNNFLRGFRQILLYFMGKVPGRRPCENRWAADFLPIAFLSIITLGLVITDMGRWAYIPSTGWVTTIGRTSQNWTGEFYGQFRMIPGLLCGRYLAIIGFTGIKIWQKSITKDFLYFGSALAVDIDYQHP